MKKVIKYLAVLFICACACVSCDSKAEFNRPLGLLSREVYLPSAAGVTPVIVYSNSTWTAEFTTPVDWAALDRLKGSGVGEVKFSYSENYGKRRKVGVVFCSGEKKDTVIMYQKSKSEEAGEESEDE